MDHFRNFKGFGPEGRYRSHSKESPKELACKILERDHQGNEVTIWYGPSTEKGIEERKVVLTINENRFTNRSEFQVNVENEAEGPKYIRINEDKPTSGNISPLEIFHEGETDLVTIQDPKIEPAELYYRNIQRIVIGKQQVSQVEI